MSKRALERKVVRGAIAEIALPEGATLVQGKRRDDVGQLEGKAYKHTGVSFWPDYHVTDDRVKVEWVRARRAPGTEVDAHAAPRARRRRARPRRAALTVRGDSDDVASRATRCGPASR